jgi:hypothetical protein
VRAPLNRKLSLLASHGRFLTPVNQPVLTGLNDPIYGGIYPVGRSTKYFLALPGPVTKVNGKLQPCRFRTSNGPESLELKV